MKEWNENKLDQELEAMLEDMPQQEELQLPSLRVNIKQNNFTTILKSVRNPDSDKTKQGG